MLHARVEQKQPSVDYLGHKKHVNNTDFTEVSDSKEMAQVQRTTDHGYPTHTDPFSMLYLMLYTVEGKWGSGKVVKDCCEIVSSMYDKEASPIKSENYSHLIKTCTMTIPVDMPT